MLTQFECGEPMPTDDATPGDLLFFAHRGRSPHHVALVTGSGRTLHAPQTGSKVTEETLAPAHMNTLIGAGPLPVLPRPTAGAR